MITSQHWQLIWIAERNRLPVLPSRPPGEGEEGERCGDQSPGLQVHAASSQVLYQESRRTPCSFGAAEIFMST
jgi:hypothetical protein